MTGRFAAAGPEPRRSRAPPGTARKTRTPLAHERPCRMWSTVVRPASVAETLDVLARRRRAGADRRGRHRRAGRAAARRQAHRHADRRLGAARAQVRAPPGRRSRSAASPRTTTCWPRRSRASAMLPLAQACIEVGAPQIRTRGDDRRKPRDGVAGERHDRAADRARRRDRLVSRTRRTDVAAARSSTPVFARRCCGPTNSCARSAFRALGAARRGIFLKLGLRRAQAISVIDIAVVVALDATAPSSTRGSRSDVWRRRSFARSRRKRS